MASRFDAESGFVAYQNIVICRIENRPLIPDELWGDDRLDFREGVEPISDDLLDVPDDLKESLLRHGYWTDV